MLLAAIAVTAAENECARCYARETFGCLVIDASYSSIF